MSASPLSIENGSSLGQRDVAYAALKRLLVLQQVPEGSRLREPDWAARLGVNRMALREAFARLEAEGFIERGPKTGYFVPTLDTEDVREILEVRAVLEAAAAERLWRSKRNTRRHLKPLKDACDELEQMIARNYPLGMSEADRRFHEALIELGGNRRLATIYLRAPLPMIHASIMQSEAWVAENVQTLQEHRAIYSALIAGVASRAARLLREHLDEG